MPNRIRELRISVNLTQNELAKKVGLNQSAIGKYEREELEPNLETLKKLSAIFECSIDYIIGFSDDFGKISIQETTPPLTAEEQRLLNDFRTLPRPERVQATEYVHYLADKRGNKNKHA